MVRKTRVVLTHFLQFLVLFVVVVGIAFSYGPLKAEAERRAEAWKNDIILSLSQTVGMEISYDGISPALLSSVEIRGISVHFPQVEFVAEKVTFVYNPLLLLRDRGNADTTRFIRRVVIESGRADIDLRQERLHANPSDLDPWPLLRNKSVFVRNFEAAIILPDNTVVQGRELELALFDEGEEARYSLSGMFSGKIPQEIAPLGEIRGEIAARGYFSPASGNLNGRLDIHSAQSDLVALTPLALDVNLDSRGLKIRRLDDERPIDLQMELDFATSLLTVKFEAEDLRVRELAIPSPERGAWDPWFSTTIDGGGWLQVSFAGDLQYDVDVQLNVPSGPLPWGWTALVDGRGDRNTSFIDDFQISASWGEVYYSGEIRWADLTPDGRVGFEIDRRILGFPIIAAFDLSAEGGAISAIPVQFSAAGLQFEDFRFVVIRESELFTVSLLAVPEASEDQDQPRSLTIDALLDTTANPVFYGFVSMEGIRSSHVARFAGIQDETIRQVLGSSSLDMDAYFETNGDSWIVSVSDAAAWMNENPENRFEFRGKASPGEWYLEGFSLDWEDYSLEGRLTALGDVSGGRAEGRIVIEEFVYPVNLNWSETGTIELYGPENLKALLGPRTARGRLIQASWENLSIPISNGLITSTVDVRGRVAQNDWDLYLNRIDLALEDNSDFGEFRLSGRGTVNPGLVVLPFLTFQDERGNLAGSAEFSIGELSGLRGYLLMNGSDGESYHASFSYVDTYWDINLDLLNSPLARLNPNRLSGRGNLSVSATGTLENPHVELHTRLVDGYLDGRPLEMSGRATLQDGKLRVRDIAFVKEGISLNRGLALVDMSEGTARLTAELSAVFNQVPVTSGFSMALDLDQSLSLTNLPRWGDLRYSGTLATRPFLWDNQEHLPALTFQFLRTDQELNIRTPDGIGLNMSYIFPTGVLSLKSQAPLPVVVEGGGTIRDGMLDLQFDTLDVDPVLINYVMVRDPILLDYHVIFQGGRFVGDLAIQGPASDPDLFGTITARDLKVDTPYTYADIGTSTSDVHFEGNRIVFEPLEVRVGNGYVGGSGEMVLDRWTLTSMDMEFFGRRGEQGQGVPVYYPLLGVDLDGEFTGEVTLVNDGRSWTLGGDLRFPILKAQLGAPIVPTPQRKDGAYPQPVNLSFNLITGNNCTFFLPNEQLKIVKANAAPGQILRLDYGSDPQTFSLAGELQVKSGDIFYFDRDFQVTEGAMVFNESLGEFNPRLSLRAETRVRDQDNEDVTVALVYNAPIRSDFNPSIETTPVKSELEILALFGQAVVPYGNEGAPDPTAVLLATGGVVAQMGLVQPFEEALRESLNLDMVTIRTDIIENALAQGLARGTEGSDEQDSGIGRYLDNTSLYAGKYIGNALFISGSVTANYFEGERLRSVFGGLEFQTTLGLEMETPFFNVGWAYQPDPMNNENIIADNYITLKWKFSY